MKQRLYRGKAVSDGRRVYGYYRYYEDGDRHKIDRGKQLESGCDVIGDTVLQCTGLQDKNGVDVYEGDIIKITNGIGNHRNGGKTIITDIFFLSGAFRYRHSDGTGSVIDFNTVKIVKGYEGITQDVEVIGNIHDNHELLSD